MELAKLVDPLQESPNYGIELSEQDKVYILNNRLIFLWCPIHVTCFLSCFPKCNIVYKYLLHVYVYTWIGAIYSIWYYIMHYYDDT